MPIASPIDADRPAAERALAVAGSNPARAKVLAEHTPPTYFRPGQPLAVEWRPTGAPPRGVRLRYRRIDQAERWRSSKMTRAGAVFGGEIPADYASTRFALQYYFEIEMSMSESTLYPQLAAGLSNMPYFVVRQAKT